MLSHREEPERWLLPVLIASAGAGMRLAWHHVSPAPAYFPIESENIAIALATTGRFADAFGPGSGLTAHTSPVMPGIIAGLYKIFGVDTPAAHDAMAVLAVALLTVSFLGFYALFGALGASRWSRLAGLAICSLVPMQPALELQQLSRWEIPLALALLAPLLVWLLRLDARPELKVRDMALPAVAAGLLALISIAAGAAACGGLGLLALRRLPARRWPAAALLVMAGLALWLGPWALRNQQALGKPILTRSNAGLELALSYNDLTLNDPDRRRGYLERHRRIHPMNPAPRAAMQAAGGEVPYNDGMGVEAKRWMLEHPQGTVSLVLRHVRQLVVPPAWFFATWGDVQPRAVDQRRWLLGLAMLVALAGLPWLAWRNPRYLYLALAMAALALPYLVVQPILRYRYLLYAPSVMLACDVVFRMLGAWWAARAPRARPIAPAG